MANIRITVSNYDRNTNTMKAVFNGQKATITECVLEMSENAELKAHGVENGRRLVPVDPLFWLGFMDSESIEIEVSINS